MIWKIEIFIKTNKIYILSILNLITLKRDAFINIPSNKILQPPGIRINTTLSATVTYHTVFVVQLFFFKSYSDSSSANRTDYPLLNSAHHSSSNLSSKEPASAGIEDHQNSTSVEVCSQPALIGKFLS